MEGQPGQGRGPPVQGRRWTDAPRRYRHACRRVRPRPRGRGHLPQDRGARRRLQADATPVGREPGGGRHPRRPRVHEGRDGIPGTRRFGDDPREGRLADRDERVARLFARLQREIHRRPRADAHARHDRGPRPANRRPRGPTVLEGRRPDGRMEADRRTFGQGGGRRDAAADRQLGRFHLPDPQGRTQAAARRPTAPVRPDRIAEGHEQTARPDRRPHPHGAPVALREASDHVSPHRLAVHHPRRPGHAARPRRRRPARHRLHRTVRETGTAATRTDRERREGRRTHRHPSHHAGRQGGARRTRR